MMTELTGVKKGKVLDNLSKNNGIKKVFFKIALLPFLISLIPILSIILIGILTKLNVILSNNLIAKFLFNGDVIAFSLIFPAFIICIHVVLLVMLLKNYKSDAFNSFKIDKSGQKCDFYNFVFGKKIGVVGIDDGSLMQWWMPLAGVQILKLVGGVFTVLLLGNLFF